MRISITHASITDKGLNPKKAVNEDSFLVLEQQGLFAVADGVGGAYAGDVASQSALDAIREIVLDVRKRTLISQRGPFDFITQLIQAANRTVHHLARKHQHAMGSTIALLLVQKAYAVLAHVGDSRIYLKRADKLLQLTVDHSKLQTLLDATPDKSLNMAKFEDGHVITKALGMKASIEPDIQKVNLKDNDIFLLCTDGITTYNSDDDILANLTQNANALPKACELFRHVCYARGARDHLTAVVLKVELKDPDALATRILPKPGG
ncbi:MAG: PP2C family protein-serine/threonine phosphatase [bacterium]